MNPIPNIASNNKAEDKAAVKQVLVARDYLLAAVLLAVVVFLWIGFGVYKILTKTEVPEPLKGLARPIKLEFPPEVLDNLRYRKNYRDLDLNETDRVILK